MAPPALTPAAPVRIGRMAAVVAAGILVVVASGCGLDEARDNAANPILGDGVTDEIDALAIVDPLIHEKLDDCVANGKLKAFAGDPEWQEVWEDSGQTEAGYRQHCERLAKNEPDKFNALHLEWTAFAASTSSGDS